MSKYISIIIVLILSALCFAFGINTTGGEEQIFRMHIRANSNLDEDQSVKLVIRDDFVEYLTPLVAECKTKQDVINLVEREKEVLQNMANNILKQNGFSYTCNIKICNEFFPERYYGDKQVKQGYYDALICELGLAKGDNWWCVVYPPLCFVDYQKSTNVVYKSKLLEIINKFFGKE